MRIGTLVALMLVWFAGQARAQDSPNHGYLFTPISIRVAGTCAGPATSGLMPPPLNNAGVIVFTDACGRVTVGDGFQQLVVFAPPTACTTPTCLTGIDAFSLSINDAGVIAMRGVAFENATGQLRDRIMTVTTDAVTSTLLREEDTPFDRFDRPRINNNNVISFGGYLGLNNTGIYTLSNGVVTTMFDPSTPTPFGPASAQPWSALNDSGHVAVFANFLTSPFGGGVFTTDGLSLTTIDSRSANTGEPSLNNAGVVAFIDGTQRLVTGDGGPLNVIAANIGTDPSSPFQVLHQPSINNDGDVAFMAQLGAHSYGIFTGPDSVHDKVVQFGDVLDLIPGGLEVQGLNLSPESLNDLGQIAFVVAGPTGRAIVRADPPGSTPKNPILPPRPTPPWEFALRQGAARAGLRTYLDPHLAVGYRFAITAGGPSSFASVLVPAPLPDGDSVFEVSFAGQTAALFAGVAFDFTAAVAGGVSEFTITGIDESEAIDPNNPLAFVTGVTFTGAFEGVVVMTPLTEESDDTAAPVLQLPSDITIAATSTSGAVVTYSATAVDDTDPDPTVGCAPASGSTFPIGTTLVRCTATDHSGNAASGSFDVTVLPFTGYQFSGFFSPVDNAPAVNRVKAGAAIPVKFSLGGSHGLSIFQQGHPVSRPMVCDTSAVVAPVEETVTAGSSTLSYDPVLDQYTYVWKTEKSWSNSCRQLTFALSDGSIRVAHFQFTK